jgi:nitrite reductase/ring-hydroxylating ferredoxin subunit
LSVNAVDAAGRTADCLAAPHPATFARYPQSWYFVCTSAALRPGAVKAVRLCGRRLAVFRGRDGRTGALGARCPHLGADLARGRVTGGRLECPYHHFRFGRNGACAKHDLAAPAYATAERFGAVFVFLGPRALFPLPSFPEEPNLVSAPPLSWDVETQWYMVGANAFDARHFALAHGRHLRASPRLSRPHPFAMHVAFEYVIEGTTWTDRAVKLVSGSKVAFDVTSWGGTVLFVRAQFRRDASFGVVAVAPPTDGGARTAVTVIVSAKRGGGGLAAALADRLRVHGKRFAIRRMLLDDAKRLRHLDYAHPGLRPGDETLAAYLNWVAGIEEAGAEPSG